MQNCDHKLINLETFVNEKLKVTKSSTVPDLISFLESKTKKEFEPKCKQLLEYLKNDSDLPMAELKVLKTGFKQLLREYENGHDTFLWVNNRLMQYGTWDELYSLYWSRANNSIRNYNSGVEGFKNFLCYDDERSYSKGVFVITENKELMKQIDYLMRKAEMFR